MPLLLKLFATGYNATGIELHAIGDDFYLVANGEVLGEVVEFVDNAVYLVDELGNYLVDESGNRLIAYNSTTVYSRSLHSVKDDFVLNSE